MAFTNSDYMAEATPTLRLDKARLFHAELAAAIGPSIGSDGKSYDAGGLRDLLASVERFIEKTEVQVGQANRPRASMLKFHPRP